MENLLVVYDQQLIGRDGKLTSVWSVYYHDHVIAVEFTRGHASYETDRVEFKEAV